MWYQDIWILNQIFAFHRQCSLSLSAFEAHALSNGVVWGVVPLNLSVKIYSLSVSIFWIMIYCTDYIYFVGKIISTNCQDVSIHHILLNKDSCWIFVHVHLFLLIFLFNLHSVSALGMISYSIVRYDDFLSCKRCIANCYFLV